MIELVIPIHGISAALLSIMMTLCAICVFFGVMNLLSQGKGDMIIIGIIMIFIADFLLMGASFAYATTPTNFPCRDDAYIIDKEWNATAIQCEYPTSNPYETQPLHPILWIVDGISYIHHISQETISIKVV